MGRHISVTIHSRFRDIKEIMSISSSFLSSFSYANYDSTTPLNHRDSATLLELFTNLERWVKKYSDHIDAEIVKMVTEFNAAVLALATALEQVDAAVVEIEAARIEVAEKLVLVQAFAEQVLNALMLNDQTKSNLRQIKGTYND